jgi:hypothetical protein
MLPTWLTILVVLFLVIALVPSRPHRNPHLLAFLAVVVVLVYEGVHSRVI